MKLTAIGCESMPFDERRRQLLGWAAAAGVGAVLQSASFGVGGAVSSDPFILGVASGAPSADGFVLWTRLVAPWLHGIEQVGVRWEVTEDRSGGRVVAVGVAWAQEALAYSVHVEVSGLAPDRWYRYRFMVGDATSETGRTRTFPLGGSAPASLRLAYASCQRWEDGFYGAYEHMLRDGPDVVLFLGDYIYEYAVRRDEAIARTHSLPRIRTLADYRARYALYRSDPRLRRAHACCPWLITWDDHEVDNDYAGKVSVEGVKDFMVRRTAAYQAFYEHMPIRQSALKSGIRGLQRGGGLTLYSQYDFGGLARIYMLDNRQFRDKPLCGEKPSAKLAKVCEREPRARRTMLGWEQEQWLENSLHTAAHDGVKWNLLAQQTRLTPRNFHRGSGKSYSPDTWDGYPGARQRLLDALSKSEATNPVILGGDIHQNWVAEVHADPYDIGSPVIASEFCGTSISSWNRLSQQDAERGKRQNPHCLLANAKYRGYGLIELNARQMAVKLRVVDDASKVDPVLSTLAEFRVRDGARKIERI